MSSKKVKEEPRESSCLDEDDRLDLHAEFSEMNGDIKEEFEENFLRILQDHHESSQHFASATNDEMDVVSLFTKGEDKTSVPTLDLSELPSTSGVKVEPFDEADDWREILKTLETQTSKKAEIKNNEMNKQTHVKPIGKNKLISKEMETIARCFYIGCKTQMSIEDPNLSQMTIVPFEKAKKMFGYLQKLGLKQVNRSIGTLGKLIHAGKGCGYICTRHIERMVSIMHQRMTRQQICALCEKTEFQYKFRRIHTPGQSKELDEIFSSTPRLYNHFQKNPLKKANRIYQGCYYQSTTFVCKEHYTEEIKEKLKEANLAKAARKKKNKEMADKCCLCGHSDGGEKGEHIRKHSMNSRNLYDHEYFDKAFNADGKINELRAKHPQIVLCNDHITEEMWMELKKFRTEKNRVNEQRRRAGLEELKANGIDPKTKHRSERNFQRKKGRNQQKAVDGLEKSIDSEPNQLNDHLFDGFSLPKLEASSEEFNLHLRNLLAEPVKANSNRKIEPQKPEPVKVEYKETLFVNWDIN